MTANRQIELSAAHLVKGVMMQDRRSRYLRVTLLMSLLAAATGCLDAMQGGETADEDTGVAVLAPTSEGFEAGSKTAYAGADVTLESGTWTMDDALIGTSESDVKSGARSARVRESGSITMGFDRSTGAGTVTIRHASFGSDSSGSWGLFSSQDGGASWTQVGAQQATSSDTLSTATFDVSIAGTIRFEIRKLDGGSNRINIDDINITDFGDDGGDDGGDDDGGTDDGTDDGADDGGGDGAGAEISVHTTLGLPTPASTGDPDDFLSVKNGYVISYNSGRKVPNWISWELNSSYLGNIDRQDDYRPDSTLPDDLPQASLDDYSGSGFDRGHMCPSGDRTLTTSGNSETFFLSNMVPQAANNNRGPWERLESESRSIANTGKELFIVSGGVFSAGSGTIGDGVSVPDDTFKVVVVLDSTGAGPGDVTEDTRVIGVMMPNSDSIDSDADWRDFRVSVDDIEAATGQDLLSDVDPAVQAVIEARVDNQ
jgi:endonuclease G, mitochondrial